MYYKYCTFHVSDEKGSCRFQFSYTYVEEYIRRGDTLSRLVTRPASRGQSSDSYANFYLLYLARPCQKKARQIPRVRKGLTGSRFFFHAIVGTIKSSKNRLELFGWCLAVYDEAIIYSGNSVPSPHEKK